MKEYTKLLLEQVRDSPEGAWSNDPITYRDNVIQWMQDKVKEALENESTNSDSLRSTGQSGDGSGGGEEEADETCQVGKPLGNSPKTLDKTCPFCEKCEMVFIDMYKEYLCPECGHTVGAFYFRINSGFYDRIHGGLAEDLDPELQSILKHRKRI